MELSDDELNKQVAETFKNVTTYDGMMEALQKVLYAPGMPKDMVRELIAEVLKSTVVSAPGDLSFNGPELVQLLERMMRFVTINTWVLQQFCNECNEIGSRCEACAAGQKVYKDVPEISVKLTVTGKPERVFNGDTSTLRTIEFSFTADDKRARETLFESEFPEMSYETKLWLTDSWKALREQYDMDKAATGKAQQRDKLIEALQKSGQVHQLSILLFQQRRCLNCGDVRPDGKWKYYCSQECDDDFGQFFKDWTSTRGDRRRYKGPFREVAQARLLKVLEKKRARK